MIKQKHTPLNQSGSLTTLLPILLFVLLIACVGVYVLGKSKAAPIKSSPLAVYRLIKSNGSMGSCILTTNTQEVNNLQTQGYVDPVILGYVSAAQTSATYPTPIYRLYHAASQQYYYTPSSNDYLPGSSKPTSQYSTTTAEPNGWIRQSNLGYQASSSAANAGVYYYQLRGSIGNYCYQTANIDTYNPSWNASRLPAPQTVGGVTYDLGPAWSGKLWQSEKFVP